MYFAFLSALGIGGATAVGGALGLLFGRIPHKYNDGLLGFAAGVMLAAAIQGLIQPAIGLAGPWVAVLGIFLGALFLNLADRFTPHLHNLAGIDRERHSDRGSVDRVLLFLLAIAIHNLPEGLAAGVAAGQGDRGSALAVTVGIMLQNIPEGVIVISPLLAIEASKKRAFALALFTGLVEVIGTAVGFFAVSVATAVLPYALSFAGGTMLYVVGDEMIPETHAHGHERLATYAMLFGFAVMLLMDFYIR